MESETKPQEQLAPANPTPDTQKPQRLTIENGTLCSFCHDMCTSPPPTGTPFHLRALPDLLEASSFCGYCAAWVRSLEASANAIVEDGQDAALMAHPLLQGFVEPSEVQLQYLNIHDWVEGGIEQRIAWPRSGTIWATLDLLPVSNSSIINLGSLALSDQSETVWNGIKFWISECTSHHTNCLQGTTSWKPTRLLHLGPLSSPMSIRLVEGKSLLGTAQYLTLSHCWGDIQPLQLTSQSIHQFKSSIPTDDLPKTFLDACNTTRKLGHEYLWIDALCITQDDPEDWAIETGRMSSTYGNSFLTIAATAAENAAQGLFYPNEERDRNAWLPALIHRSWGAQFSGDFYVCDYRDWWAKLGDSPLNRRGWAFQERILSPRVLHLGLEQVAFECPSMTACERLPFGNLGRIHGEMGGPGSNMKRFLASESAGGQRVPDVVDVLVEWNELVRNYAHGRFAVGTDKMVALTGVVDSFANLFDRATRSEDSQTVQPDDDTSKEAKEAKEEKLNLKDNPNDSPKQNLFVGGLWRPRMEMQLAWRATSKVQAHQLSGNAPPGFGTRPQAYVAPTWSWCSLNHSPVEPQQSNPSDIALTAVLEVKINPTQRLNTSSQESGLKYCCAPESFLRLRCSLVPLAGFDVDNVLVLPYSDGVNGLKQISSRNYWDASCEEEAGNAKMPCLVPTFVEMNRVSRAVHGLVLDMHLNEESGERYYTRLGVFVLEQPEDIKALWDAVAKFDLLNPGTQSGSIICDGIQRPVGAREYLEKDGILQRVICIR